MALKQQSETIVSLTSKIALPRDRYVALCMKEKFAPSQSGNPMITREWQVVQPEFVDIGGQKVVVSGVTFQQYLPTKVKDEEGRGWDEEKSSKALGRIFTDYNALGFPTTEGIDDENPALHAEGVYADVILWSEESVARKNPTLEQKAKRELGDPILDAEGKQIRTYQVKLLQVLGRAKVEPNVPY